MHHWENGWVSKVLIHLSWKRQISADSVGSGSNLNCSCLIVCYLFFPKIISSYLSNYLIRNTWFGGDTSRFGRWPRAPTLERVNSHAGRVVTAWLWCCHVFWEAYACLVGWAVPRLVQEKNYNIRFSRGYQTMLKHELAAKCLISGTRNVHG